MALAAFVNGLDLGTAIAYATMLLGTKRVLPMSFDSVSSGLAILSRRSWRAELKKSLVRSAICVPLGACLVMLSAFPQLEALADAGVGLFFAALLVPLATLFVLARAMSDEETFAFPVGRTATFFPA